MDNNNSNPIVTVILPVYNAELYIKEAIDSVLNQSYKSFEFLVFNDASTDKTESILNSFNDSRIKLFSSSDNKGYLHYLNLGITQAKGKYIARMDADDICENQRLEKQVDYLDKNDEVGVVGSSIQIFGDESRVQHYPGSSNDCALYLLSRSCFAHPAVMFRKSIIVENNIKYNAEYYTAEDYYLWVQLYSKTSFHNIKEVLLNYRINPGSISIVKKKEQFHLKNKIQLFALNEILGIKLNQAQQETYLAMLNPFQKIKIYWEIIYEVLDKIENLSIKEYPFIDSFISKLKDNIIVLVFYNHQNGLTMVNGFFDYNKRYKINTNKIVLAKLYVKAFMKRKSG